MTSVPFIQTYHTELKERIPKLVSESFGEIMKMLHFLLNNVYIQVNDRVFQQCVGIPMGTNCAPLLADLLHDYKSTAMILSYRRGKSPISKSFSLTRQYIDD